MVWCPLSIRKIEHIQERELRILLNDFELDYEQLLVKADKVTMLIHRHRQVAVEIFKTLYNLNPPFMKDIFTKNKRENSRYPNNLTTHMQKGFTYGENSIKSLGPKIWNSLPNEFKSHMTISKFKNLIKTWDGSSCECNMCCSYQ